MPGDPPRGTHARCRAQMYMLARSQATLRVEVIPLHAHALGCVWRVSACVESSPATMHRSHSLSFAHALSSHRTPHLGGVSICRLRSPEEVLSAVRHVEESVLVVVVIIDALQGGDRRRQSAGSDEKKDGLLGCELDPLRVRVRVRVRGTDTGMRAGQRGSHDGGLVQVVLSLPSPVALTFRMTYINWPMVRSAGTRNFFCGHE